MIRPQTLRLACMLCVFFTLCEPLLGADSIGPGCYNQKKTFDDANCSGTAYNSANATCCGGRITNGLSENMSQCCGPKAYNPLNEICCDSTVHAKPSPNAMCCGKDPFDNKTQLCCGPEAYKKAMTKLSSDHQCCMNISQFNIKLECCCPYKNPIVQLQIKGTACCVKNFTTTPRPQRYSNQETTKPNDLNNSNNSNKSVCCENGDRVETYSKKEGFECCGHYYYNKFLWQCRNKRLTENPCFSSLDKAKHCRMFIGILENKHLDYITFNSVFRISGKKLYGSFHHKIFGDAKSLNLVAGMMYLFSDNEVFTELINQTTLKSLHSFFVNNF